MMRDNQRSTVFRGPFLGEDSPLLEKNGSFWSAQSAPTEGGEHVRTQRDIPLYPDAPISDIFDTITTSFSRVWLLPYLRALEAERRNVRSYAYSYGMYVAEPLNSHFVPFLDEEEGEVKHEEDDCNTIDSQDFYGVDNESHSGEPGGDGVLLVYGGPEGKRAWEVQSFYELSRQATKHYKLAIFFMSSDRTAALWCSPNPEYLAVCYVRGLGNRVKGVNGWGRASMMIEPDALFRGYVELYDNSTVKCRLSHVDDLYSFGSGEPKSTFELLCVSVTAGFVSLAAAQGGSRNNSGTVKALAGVLALVGKEYWPGWIHTMRTCSLGVVGGVTGVLVSRREPKSLQFLRSIELPLLIALCFLFPKDWQVLTTVIGLLVVPTYWSSIFRNRTGEGGFWGIPLAHREFEVADAAPSTKTSRDGRLMFTLRRDNPRRDQTKIMPAYAMGFNAWDLFGWAIGWAPVTKTDATSLRVAVACVILSLEVLLAYSSSYFLSAGMGVGHFLGCRWAVLTEADGTLTSMSRLERFLGILSGFFVSASLAVAWFDVRWTWGFPGVALWVSAIALASNVLALLLARCSDMLGRVRRHIAKQTRALRGIDGRNWSHTGRWRGMFKCRKLVKATFPRVAGYAYYDGELINVHSGWYYPACGRVAFSVPRSKISYNPITLEVKSFDTAKQKYPLLLGLAVPEQEGTVEVDEFETEEDTSSSFEEVSDGSGVVLVPHA